MFSVPNTLLTFLPPQTVGVVSIKSTSKSVKVPLKTSWLLIEYQPSSWIKNRRLQHCFTALETSGLSGQFYLDVMRNFSLFSIWINIPSWNIKVIEPYRMVSASAWSCWSCSGVMICCRLVDVCLCPMITSIIKTKTINVSHGIFFSYAGEHWVPEKRLVISSVRKYKICPQRKLPLRSWRKLPCIPFFVKTYNSDRFMCITEPPWYTVSPLLCFWMIHWNISQFWQIYKYFTDLQSLRI